MSIKNPQQFDDTQQSAQTDYQAICIQLNDKIAELNRVITEQDTFIKNIKREYTKELTELNESKAKLNKQIAKQDRTIQTQTEYITNMTDNTDSNADKITQYINSFIFKFAITFTLIFCIALYALYRYESSRISTELTKSFNSIFESNDNE